MDNIKVNSESILDLGQFVSRFPGLRLAGRQDNHKLLQFFHSSQLRGKDFDLLYDRSPDFFAFLDLHSKEHCVLIYENQQGLIQGIATFLFRQALIEGKIEKICYLGDLRMGFDRRALAIWRKAYSEIMTNRNLIEQLCQVRVFYTVLIDQNQRAQRSLVNPKNVGYRYDPVCGYEMANLIFNFNWFAKTEAKVIATERELAELLLFYENNQGQEYADYVYSSEIPKRIESWPEFSIKNFIVLKKGNSIIAATALWAPTVCKKIQLSRPPWWWRLLGRNEHLKVGYFTHLQFDRSLTLPERNEAFHQLALAAWRTKGEYQMLAYTSFSKKQLKPKGFLMQKIGMRIFEVSDVSSSIALFKDGYGFEMALV